MRVLITGSRKYNNYEEFTEMVCKHISEEDTIVCGTSEGVEELASRLAKDRCIRVDVFNLNPSFKNAAWFIRNKAMVDSVDKAVIMWDTKSKGTAKTIKMVQDANKELIVYKVTE